MTTATATSTDNAQSGAVAAGAGCCSCPHCSHCISSSNNGSSSGPRKRTAAAAAASSVSARNSYKNSRSSSRKKVEDFEEDCQSDRRRSRRTTNTTAASLCCCFSSSSSSSSSSSTPRGSTSSTTSSSTSSSSSSPSSSSSSSPSPSSKHLLGRTPILLVCTVLFVLLAASSLAIILIQSRNQKLEREEQAYDLAIQTGQFFKEQLDLAILPLFSIAQFAVHLEMFQSLPKQIGEAYESGSLPFVKEQNGDISSRRRNVTGVCDAPQLVDKFISIATGIKQMSQMDKILVNLQLAPHVAPDDNTEDFDGDMYLDSSGAWGLDLLNDPNMRYIARLSVERETVTVAGPRKLVQCPDCGDYFIARLPIYDPSHTMIGLDGQEYPRWGFATALIDWDRLVEKSGIYEQFDHYSHHAAWTHQSSSTSSSSSSTSSSGGDSSGGSIGGNGGSDERFEFILTRTDRVFHETSNEYVFSTTVLAESPGYADGISSVSSSSSSSRSKSKHSETTVSLETTNNEWEMTVVYWNQDIQRWTIIVSCVCIVVSFLIAWLVFLILNQKQLHSNMVAKTSAQDAQVETERNMTAYFAHELRNPLSAMDCALNIIETDSRDHEDHRGGGGGDDDSSSVTTTNTSSTHGTNMNRELIEGMKLSCSLMTSIMQNLLDARKLQENMMELRPQPMSLSKLLAEVRRMMLPLVKPGVHFINENSTTPLNPEHDWVVGDYYRIQQVLTNMITNAIKYTLTGEIRLRAFWTSARQVQIEIIDSGPGIPLEVQPKLFERFVQRGGAPGHGLGLPISKQLVEIMGGTIRFDSDPSVKPGTTCVVVLPLEPVPTSSGTDANTTHDDDDADALSLTSEGIVVVAGANVNNGGNNHQRGVAASASSTQTSTPTAASNNNSSSSIDDRRINQKPNRTPRNQDPISNKSRTANTSINIIEEPIRILIVDDIKMNRMMAQRRILKNLAPNAEITLAVNGEEAMEIMTSKKAADTTQQHQPMFHIIIMDQYMGESGGVMTGTDTIIAMRRNQVESLIIGCSGNDIDDEFYSAGANIVWGKPLPPDQEMISHFREGLEQFHRSL
eukprot:CAMPEP_0113485144 /NCGR_PEP_ID=MMETSP0014_2-20120614/24332_1 /TAXON_ID=2857 /ORGANISM="Nitzschia sp." /LENGTH=1072 /DNA_ID=CAMNT_0000378781 /DNA_START=26 /DNA_END=3245 /DNA_ORIENTATION=- /assembly_acc=CAM_ASM_000159